MIHILFSKDSMTANLRTLENKVDQLDLRVSEDKIKNDE